MASENETVDEIVKEMRGPYYKIGRSNARLDHDMMGYMSFIANRIESAWRREKAKIMQAATEVAMDPTEVRYEPRPKRNCDRFNDFRTAHREYVKAHGFPQGCDDEEHINHLYEFLDWLFAPVTEGGEK